MVVGVLIWYTLHLNSRFSEKLLMTLTRSAKISIIDISAIRREQKTGQRMGTIGTTATLTGSVSTIMGQIITTKEFTAWYALNCTINF